MLLTEMLRSIQGSGRDMAEVQFFQTAMGRTFFEYTMPELVRELKKLNANLEKLNEKTESKEVLPYVEPRDDGGR